MGEEREGLGWQGIEDRYRKIRQEREREQELQVVRAIDSAC